MITRFNQMNEGTTPNKDDKSFDHNNVELKENGHLETIILKDKKTQAIMSLSIWCENVDTLDEFKRFVVSGNLYDLEII